MGRAYSDDLRERVVRAVIKCGLSRHQAAAHLGEHQHGDQLGPALPGDRQRQAGPDRWLSAKEDCGAAPRMADATVRVSRDREQGFQRIVSNDFRGS
jgi:transposase